MAELHFSVASPQTAFYTGHNKLKSDVATAYNGTLLELSAGEWIVDTGAGNARGILDEQRQFVEFPTSDNVASDMKGKYVNVATGSFRAFIGKDLFSADAIPSVGAKLYAGTAGGVGKYAASGATAIIGIVEGTTTITDETGTAFTVAICYIDLSAAVGA